MARYNSSDDDNVTQVGKKKKSFTIFPQLCIRFHLVFQLDGLLLIISLYTVPPSVKHLTGRIQDSSPICVFRCRFAPSTPRCSTKRSARDSARTLQDPWRGLSSSSRNAWWVHTLSARLWVTLFSLCSARVYCYYFHSRRKLLIPVVWGFDFPPADAVPAFAFFFLLLPACQVWICKYVLE